MTRTALSTLLAATLAACGAPMPEEDFEDETQAIADNAQCTWGVYRTPQPSSAWTGFLSGCPALRDHIVWEAGSGTRVSYANWTANQKIRLYNLYQALLRGDTALNVYCPLDPLTNMAQPSAPTARNIYLTAGEAFDIYAAHVAHALYLEARELVPWTITTLPAAEKAELLSSDRYHSRIKPSGLDTRGEYPSHIVPGRDFQQAFRARNSFEYLICDPREGYRFMVGSHSTGRARLLGTSEEDTLVRMSAWARDNLTHGGADIHGGTAEHSSRREIADSAYLRKRLLGRNLTSVGYGTPAVARVGCHSAAGILQDLARSVNLPLLNVASQHHPGTSAHFGNRTHRGLIFRFARSNPLVLHHVDDIYANFDGRNFGGSGGAPVSDRTYFDTFWLTPANLRAWQFDYLSSLPTVVPGAGWGVNDAGSYEQRYDFGKMAGHWPAAATGTTGLPSTRYRWEKGYALCEYATMIETYCTLGTDALYEAQVSATLGTTSYSYPVAHTPAQFATRARACVAAAGGCAAANATMTAYWAARGRNVGSSY
jgi:hypothetical protein